MRGDNGGAAGFIGVSDHQQREHCLANVEAVSPVVVGDPPVPFTDRVHEPHQDLQTHTTLLSSCV